MMKLSIASVASVLVYRAHGHGGIFNYTIDGVDYAGNFPYINEEEQNVIQRRWWPDQIQDVASPYLSCNRNFDPSQPRKSMPLHAPIAAGSNISATWTMTFECRANIPFEQDGYTPCNYCNKYWVHGLGPIIAYMANCNGPCSDVDTAKLKWFKIEEKSFVLNHDDEETLGYAHKEWFQFDYAKNWTLAVPKGLRPGNYMLRHEIVMLELWPPQFYPNCVQLEVTGEGTEEPGEEYLVEFPGAYYFEDPGIKIAGMLYGPEWRNTTNYTIPGPNVWTGAN